MTRLLDRIDTPQDLHALSEEQLQQVAQEVREHIIDTVGEIGGHFGANLGTAEIAVALHSLMDSPKDKILWDVGHQSYPHKILTGRRDQLSTIRKYDGLAPFCAIHESEHDIMGAGHASTSIGYGVGLREGMKLREAEDPSRTPGRVVAVIGDGAMTGGVAFEAAQQAGGLGTPLVVILNDNGMSISPNVGSLSRYFQGMRLHPKLWHGREKVEERLTDLPAGLGGLVEQVGPKIKGSMKLLNAQGELWESLDWAYVGVVDGHDVRDLRQALRQAFKADRPVVVHVKTVKGKGFAPAEDGGLEGMEQWHAAKPGSIVAGAPAPKVAADPDAPPKPPTYTQVFGERMIEEVRRDRRVVGITAAMNTGTGLNLLQVAEPEHYFDVGIAEQQALLFASGLALEGLKPVAAIYSTFLQRAYDQIVHDVCLQELDVVLAMDRAGLVGDDGPTHHGVFDIAYLRHLPNIVLAAPRDEAQLVHLLHTGIEHPGTFALRYPRGEGTGVPLPSAANGGVQTLPIGKGEVLRQGDRLAILGYGSGVGVGLEAAAVLHEAGIEATVADARWAKPIDVDLVRDLARDHELLVTIEEGVLPGGFGSAVWEAGEEHGVDWGSCRIMRVGMPDRYVTHGTPKLLHAEVGFTGKDVATRVGTALGVAVGAAAGA